MINSSQTNNYLADVCMCSSLSVELATIFDTTASNVSHATPHHTTKLHTTHLLQQRVETDAVSLHKAGGVIGVGEQLRGVRSVGVHRPNGSGDRVHAFNREEDAVEVRVDHDVGRLEAEVSRFRVDRGEPRPVVVHSLYGVPVVQFTGVVLCDRCVMSVRRATRGE